MSTLPQDYSAFKEGPGDNILAQISGMARAQLEAQARVAKAEDELRAAKDALRVISEKELPELMAAAQQKQVTTRDGLTVKCKEVLRASIPEARLDEGLKWLEDRGDESLIKRQFTIEFGRDEEKWAAKFQRDLAQRKKPLNTKLKRSVNPQTLAAHIRELLGNGVGVPLDVFGVIRQMQTEVKSTE